MRPYVCTICNKGFRQTSNLKRHMLVHEKIPVKCDICKRKFIRKCELAVHIKSHAR